MATKATVVAPLSDRYFLFNYFVKPPMDDKVFYENWAEVADYIADKKHFLSTHLHHCTSPEAKYPWVNFAVFDSEDICAFGKPDPEWMQFMKKGNASGLQPLPGQYREISSFKGNELTCENKQRPSEYRFLLTAVSADESVSNENLEANWTSWMGSDFIQGHLKENSALGDSILYRFVKGRLPTIRYTVRTELSGMSDEGGNALAELVNSQPQVNGVHAWTGFYRVITDMFYKPKQ